MTPEQQAAIREAVARGMCSLHARHSPDHTRSDEDMMKFIDWHWPAHADQADAAIAAHLKALEAAGIVPCPVEPTEAMIEAAYGRRHDAPLDSWNAMLAARPR